MAIESGQHWEWEEIACQVREWKDAEGVIHKISEMDDEYRGHAANFFIQNHASLLYFRVFFGSARKVAESLGVKIDAVIDDEPVTQLATGPFAHQLQRLRNTTPELWAETLPLVRALRSPGGELPASARVLGEWMDI